MTDSNVAVVPTTTPGSAKALRNALTRRIRGLGQLAKRHSADAATMVGTLLRLWCEADFPALPPSRIPYDRAMAKEPAVLAFAELLKSMELLEASYWLSSVYAMLAEDGYRKHLAMFFTPASLTRGLLDDLAAQGVDYSSHSFFDPACGGAAFLAPIALRMRDSLRRRGFSARRVLAHVGKNLYGTDLDPILCELSKQFICMALYSEIEATEHIPELKVHPANSLQDLASMFGTVDVIVCNPPYRKMNSEELEPLRDLFSDVIQAQPNLYGVFISLCVRLLRVGGHAALVTPTSFLSGQYFSKLREYLISNTVPLHIGMVSDRDGVFIDVEQETALTVLRRREVGVVQAIKTRVSVVSADGCYTDVGDCVLPNSGKVWPIPRAIKDVALLKAAASSRFQLSDYGYEVRIGSYVWNRDTRPRFSCLADVRKAKSATAVPLLWSRDISTDGVLEFDAYATPGDVHRFVDLGDRFHSSVVRKPCVVLQRVTSNDQPRRLVAAPVPSHIFASYGGFVGENHVVIVEQHANSPALTPRQLTQLLSTEPVDRYFRCISGATNVSAFELRQLKLPDPNVLKQHLAVGIGMEAAVKRAFGIADKGTWRDVEPHRLARSA
ncbi:HsdM family class I SAM-dependent methyltransferase [Burkholderia cenocepacia]|uniref:HsdM family class I SAM-dependent methyltransferase n=1 Tax=Burkholderia cenocepacia TaxID=95486 RepID=UPI002AB164CB|nr:N-6 DNA methylase [Burkholderia cenocepacia]